MPDSTNLHEFPFALQQHRGLITSPMSPAAPPPPGPASTARALRFQTAGLLRCSVWRRECVTWRGRSSKRKLPICAVSHPGLPKQRPRHTLRFYKSESPVQTASKLASQASSTEDRSIAETHVCDGRVCDAEVGDFVARCSATTGSITPGATTCLRCSTRYFAMFRSSSREAWQSGFPFASG